MYYLRTDIGTLVAKFDNHIAGKLIRTSEGHWTEKVFAGGKKKTCFVFTGDYKFGNDLQTVYIWANYYLCYEV